ncbi:PKD domain-containing protein [Lacinutrix undariae]
MKHKYPLPLFFACFLLISTIALTAPIFSVNTFLTPSATIAGSTTICQNSAMPIVTFIGSGGSAPYTFEYTINNGSTLTISTTDSDNSVSIPVNTGTSGTFTYTLVGVSDSVDIDIETQSGSAVIAVQPTPDTSMGGTGSGSVYEGVSVFRVCMNTSSLFNFTNTSSTQGGLNTNYTIDWGDGSPNFSGNSWSVLSHTYDVGLWNVMYTVEGNNGCSSTQNYIVFVGSNPAVSLGNPGNTDVCNTSSLTFPITGTENNPPGTTYTVTFNDGSESEVFNHPPPASVTHTFLTSSCGINSSDGTNTYENSFSANILASNPCSSSSVGVVPIYVSTAPEANFDSPEIACINTSVCLTNQSIGDTNTGSSSACNTTPNIIWSISPDTGFTISSGSLGNDFGLTDASSWFSGSDELCLSFSESGTYTITQNAGNTCGFDSISETICIDTPLTPIFNLDEISICGPDEVNAINNTDESLSCSDVTYLWEVDYTSDFCNSSTTGSWSFINGTDLNTINASFNFVTPGVYTISLTVSNSCGEETTTQNVNVKQPPKVEINSIADVCNTFNISPSAIISECTDDSTSMAYAWSFVGATPATSNLENPGEIVYATPGTYTITLQVTNDCGVSETATETFTIKETPVITNTNLSQSICSGSYTDAIDLTSSVPGTSYSWTAVGTSGVTGFTTSGTTNTIPAQIISTTSSVSGTVTYSVTPTAELCLGDAVDFVITVNPAPQFVTQPLSSNVCQNGTATILEVSLSNNINTPNYQWYSNNSNSTSGGILISGATNSTYQPPTDVEGTLYYYCEITFPIEGCTSLVSNIAEVEVAPIPKISVEPIETESLCVGGNIDTPFEVVHTGGLGPVSYQWFSNTSNSSTGGTEISGATSSTYTPNIFNTVGTYFYYVELSFNISGCTNVTSSVTEVNVLDLPLVDVQAETSQTLCVSATPIDLEIEVSGGVSDFAYQWYSNGSNSTTGGTEISGATNAIYTPSTNTAGTIYYYCVVYQPASPSCSVVSAISEVIVNEAPAFVEQPSSQALCLGDTVSDLEMTYENGVGTATLQWYSNTANDTATGTEITGATNNIYSPDVSVTGTTYYYGIITFSEGGCTEIFSDIAEISVSETPGIITQAVATQTLCESITPQDLEVEVSGTTGVFSYQWYSNTSNSTTGGVEISGATSAIYTPLTDVIGTTYYYVEVYNTLNATCKVVSAISEVIVNEAPAFVGQPSSQALCLGDTVSDLEMTYTNGVGTTTLQWYSNTTNDTATGTEISGAINSIYSPDVSIIGTTYYYGIITFSEGGCTEIISDIAEISVSETPEIITQAIATQTLCESITPQGLEVEVSGTTGVFSYQWYSNGSNSTTGGTEISGATSETYTPETDVVGTTYYYVEIYNTLNSTCKVVSAISEVIVNEAPAFVEQPSSQALCLGETVSDLEMTYENGVGTATLQWYSNTVNDTATGIEISGATSTTYTPDVSVAGTTYFYGIITFSEGGCTEIISEVAVISVSETPEIITQAVATQTLCESITPQDLEVEVSGTTGVFSYQWYSNGSNSTTGGTEISGATSETYTPETDVVGTTYYYVEIYNTLNSTCKVVSAISEVIVNEAPAFVEQPSSQALCLGETVSDLEMTYQNGVGTATLQWYSNTVNDTATGTEISGAINNIYSPDVSIIGTTYYYGIITFSEGGCTEIISDIAEISVSETPEIITQAVATQTLCESITPQDLEVEISGTTGVFSYQWYSNGSNSTTGGTEISGATTETYPPETDVIGTTYYYVEIYNTLNDTCKVVSAISEVIVNEAPAFVGQPSSQALCLGDTVTDLEMTYENGVGTTTLQWYSNTTNDTATGTEISGAINSIYSPDVSIIGTTYYYGIITFSEGGCSEIISDIAEISVSEVPVIDTQALATQTLCESITATTLELTVSGGVDVFSYQWYSNGSNSTTGGTEITGATSETYTPETDAVGTTYYYVEIYNTLNDTCKVVSAISEVIVNEAPAFVEQPESEILCLGESASVLEMSYINGVGVPGLQWYSNTVNSSIGGTIITGAIDSTYSPDVSIVGTTYYYGVITFSEGGCSEIVSDVVEIIVNDTPSIDDLVIVVCSEKVFTVNPDATNGSSVPANTTYTWNMPTVSPLGSITGISEENNPQTEISQVLTNNTTSPAVVTYVVTPVSGLCIGENFTIEVTVNPSISTEIIVVNSFCFESNSGSISAVISGGVPFSTGNPYIINWMGPNGFVADTATISNLEPGDYVLTIDDEGGCPLSETYTITEPEILSMVVDTETSISCFEAADGEITISVSGGTLNYTYNWTKDGIPFSTDEDIYNLEPGNYEITISDANNCGPVNQAFLITEPDELEVSLASKDDVLCYGFSTGSINITTIGGTPTEVSPGVFDYNYQWTGPNGFLSSTSDLIGLIAGTYQLTVTDANNCSDTLNVTLTQPDEIVINYTFTEITCYGAEDASINITSITGGAGIFDIAWNNFAEGLVQNNLSAGDYIVTVTDADNCEMSTTITIPEAPIFAISPDIEHVSCFGANDGRITLNFQGGQDPIDVIWDDDSTAGVERNNLAPGTYNLTISDGTPCYIYETFTILEPDILAITANISNAFDCDDPNSGAINLIITGGTTPYTVNWSNGSTTEDLNNIPPGTYFVEVVDANGCEISDSYTIVRPSPIVVDVITETEADCDNVNVTQTFVANVSGGVPPYQLNWSNGTVSGVNNEFMNTTQNGLVILEATDDLGCVSSFTFEVDIPELSAADFETTSIAYQTYGLYSMADPIEFFNTTSGDYESVFWDFGDGNFSSEENPTHIYTSEGPYVVTQTVTFPFGCVYTKVVTLIIEKGYKLIMPNAFSPNQDGINDYFTPVYIGLDDMELNIYDTWGSLIYTEANDDIQGWDGTVNGESAENGNYYYTFTAKTFYGSKIKENGAFVSIK